MNRFLLIPLFAIVISFSMCQSPALMSIEPPNHAGEVISMDNSIRFLYDGKEIMHLNTDLPSHSLRVRELKEENDNRITHSFTISSISGNKFTVNGMIIGSDESFPCEADRRLEGTQVVRHAYGLSHNLLNRAVYDRHSDWLLSVDQSYTSSDLVLKPEKADTTGITYSIAIQGDEVTFRFRPRYYQQHRGLRYFEPWSYEVWKQPVAGWCSWYAYKTDITEEKIKEVADVLEATMKPYGLEYLQIDDGYQQPGGSPESWLIPNKRFPSGMDDLARYISSKGLKPGIWTNVAVHDSVWACSHPDWFVTGSDGQPERGRWIGFIMDGSRKEMLDSVVSPVYRNYKESGWQYFKLDALRHLLFEGYNSHSQYFENQGLKREEAFRDVIRRVREDVGRENFLLSCWGVLPAVIGLADGCRIGNDGYGYTSLAQFNSFNNVVWRNDPDHIELTPREAYRSCMATSLTGSLFMVTDKPSVYFSSIIIPARKSLPVLFTIPGQVFDLDPSRSMDPDRTLTEMSGSGERETDGSRTSPFDLFMLELNMPWERWCVLGRLDENEKQITLRDLGLEAGRQYLVYEYWTDTFMGTVNDKIVFSSTDPLYDCQLYCIRPVQGNPQIIATSRHISCGATDLSLVSWKDGVLSGVSRQVPGENYSLLIYEPSGYGNPSISADNGTLLSEKIDGRVRKITFAPHSGEDISWKLTYRSSAGK